VLRVLWLPRPSDVLRSQSLREERLDVFRVPEFVELGHSRLVLGAPNDQVGIRINTDGFEVAICQEAALSTQDSHLLAAAYEGLGKNILLDLFLARRLGGPTYSRPAPV
jgi:hypothetical protein